LKHCPPAAAEQARIVELLVARIDVRLTVLNCQSQMMLANIKFWVLGFDLRTYSAGALERRLSGMAEPSNRASLGERRYKAGSAVRMRAGFPSTGCHCR
jgi:hypothetical protein